MWCGGGVVASQRTMTMGDGGTMAHTLRGLWFSLLCASLSLMVGSWFVGQMMDDGDRDRHRRMDDDMDDGTRWKKWDR